VPQKPLDQERGSQDHGFDDLMGIDLSTLDLDHIDIEDRGEPNPAWRWVTIAFLLIVGGVVLYVPNTDFYQMSNHSSWLFPVLSIVGTVVGILLGRWFWLWAEAAAQRWMANRRPPETREPPKPPSPMARALTLIAAVVGAGVLLYAVSPSDTMGGASGYTWVWYVAAIAAIVVGVFLGRWLLMQEHNPFPEREPRPTFKFPPWTKWVTLAAIIIGSVVVLTGMSLFSADSQGDLEFALGAASFVIGIVAAVWVARRFDEVEGKIRKEVEQRKGRT
jgi:uncharacterized membrane protein YidH (DUF202 family)